MERSVFSDRMVFVRAVHEAKFMSDMEISIYDSWFDPIVSGYPYFVTTELQKWLTRTGK